MHGLILPFGGVFVVGAIFVGLWFLFPDKRDKPTEQQRRWLLFVKVLNPHAYSPKRFARSLT